MFGLIGFAVSAAAVIVGYVQSKDFVAKRLRYVDAARAPFAPLIAGAGAALVAAPVVALLPVIGIGTALAFGVSVGVGVAAGARDIRRSLPPG